MWLNDQTNNRSVPGSNPKQASKLPPQKETTPTTALKL